MQIFSPPYLFRGPRPVIAGAPAATNYGSTISVTSPDAASVARITLVRPGSTTHGFNMTQRIEEVSFQNSADGQTLRLQMPTNPNLALPGYYMLFLLNNLGVPSTATFIRLGSQI